MMTQFRIRLCTKYGRRAAAWGQWITGIVESPDAYERLLNDLCRDRQVHAFEAERLPDCDGWEWWQRETYNESRVTKK